MKSTFTQSTETIAPVTVQAARPIMLKEGIGGSSSNKTIEPGGGDPEFWGPGPGF